MLDSDLTSPIDQQDAVARGDPCCLLDGEIINLGSKVNTAFLACAATLSRTASAWEEWCRKDN